MHHNVLDTRLVKNELNPKHSIHHFSPLHSEVKLYTCRFAAKHSTKILNPRSKKEQPFSFLYNMSV